MKIKKYQAETEEAAIEMAKQELGTDAIVLSIKKIKPNGIFSSLKKPYVELKASYDETKVDLKKSKFKNKKAVENALLEKDVEIQKLENRISELEAYLERAMQTLSKSVNSQNTYKNQLVQFIYEMLIHQGVLPNICYEVLENVEDESDTDMDLVVNLVYNNIVEILKGSEAGELFTKKDDNKNILFLGTTGVGKTTSIAKISSNLIMNEGRKIGFITADTYRIAAVEQLKTYAEILGSNVEVVYTPQEAQEKIDKLSVYNDFVFFDTAGRSHKHEENMEEIQELVKSMDSFEAYLVVSMTFGYEDVKEIVETYGKFMDFKIIFTKVDETNTLGTILNIAYMTKKKIAYVSHGQNVPNDIGRFSPEKISKALLGSMDK